MNTPSIRPAFREPSEEAQSIFRIVMEAMARPGRIFPLTPSFTPPAPLAPSAAALLLTLADFETPIWLDGTLAGSTDVCEFLRFHTGAKLTPEPEAAVFAVIAGPLAALPLAAFAQGSLEYPDRSATLILQVEELHPDGWVIEGPGICGQASFGASPLPKDFAIQLAENRGRFPCGVDLIFAARDAIAALPRGTRLVGGF